MQDKGNVINVTNYKLERSLSYLVLMQLQMLHINLEEISRKYYFLVYLIFRNCIKIVDRM